MHELSIAESLIEMAESTATDAGASGITSLHLRLGAISGVVPDALYFCFDIAAKGTLAEGATLEIERLPVIVYCPACEEEVTLPNTQRFRCPRCDTPTPQIVQGREMQLVSLQVPDDSDGDER